MNENYLAEIIPNLFIGNIQDARNKIKLEYNNINAILNCAEECENIFYDNIEIQKLYIIDKHDENINRSISKIYNDDK
jgi:hypothetical protein